MCNGEPLATVSSAKYLGVVIDDDLSWASHIHSTSLRCRQAIARLWRHRDSLSYTGRRLWYLAMVQSKLCYGSNAIYPSLSVQYKSIVNKLCKSGVRAVFGVTTPARTQPLLLQLHVSLVTDIMHRKVLVFVFRCISSSASTLFEQFYSCIAPHAQVGSHPVTRGQATQLLSVPFLPGPGGRQSIQFRGSVWWNSLPSETRTSRTLQIFQQHISKLEVEINC